MLGTMAQGDLSHRIDGDHQGLFARLAQDANSLAEKLSEIVGRLVTAAGTVRDASSEISTGSHDLAQRTEQQASRLQHSEERRGGKACVWTSRSRCSTYS